MNGSRVTPEIKFMFIYDIMWGMKSTQEWLQSCSENQVCVHICHHVGYNGKCTSVAPIAPEIKFVFIYGIMWGI